MWSAWALILFTVTSFQRVTAESFSSPFRDRNSPGSPFIEITVSPVATATAIRILDISWSCPKAWKSGDWVALYNVPPSDKKQESLFSSSVETDKGWVRTGVEEKRLFPEEPDFKKKCLGFWAVYWRWSEEEPVATTCLTTNPTWMQDNWDSIKNVRLKQVFLPGSHDAGAYQLAYSPFAPSYFQKYVFAQDESILEQLIHGARYLDFRIGRYPSGFWLNHDIARVHVLEFVFEDVKLFLNNTKEIVVIDLHAFPVGFKERPESHTELVEFIKLQIGDHLVGFMGYESTLQQIRDTGKRLIIAYNDPSIVPKYPLYLWHPISQKWGNVRSVPDLYNYLSKVMKSHPPRSTMWSAMAEMTPDAWSILSDKYKGLRNMADQSNHNVTEWFRDEWGAKANIVAVDFIRSTGIVAAAIRWNREKSSARHHHKRSVLKT
uniref:PI-PLC X domain-containing protein 1 n=2 Tax=Lygus hesperus TaxID=30085 RepID=A0A0A9YT85_LYGHE